MKTLNCRHSLEADERKVNCEYVLRLFRGRHTDSRFLLLTYEKPELPQLAAPVYFLSQILDDTADKLCVKHYYPPCRKGENLSFLPVAIIPQ